MSTVDFDILKGNRGTWRITDFDILNAKKWIWSSQDFETSNGKNYIRNRKTHDFYICKGKITARLRCVVEHFVFSDYSDDPDDTSDVFEDSKEMQSEDEFLTPLNFTSLFGQRTAALSASTPNLSRSTSKRAAPSPKESGQPKRSRSKSLLPVRK